ncbi:hypothetical protein JNUCC1_01371 [Lentibacillus sp. JNUCC-1]|uniref:DUF6773 family protein n=1 Tax=Lentibacillus sp. JNUCC-1 TaxID=2654513 RepID=UPI0012E6F3B3|nr:DUF6773 family protein [Lentibacillus sp. JNUCC-1]MUV37565.1 hypothetical protein [Lentibacillus sp. JNUCC-1]
MGIFKRKKNEDERIVNVRNKIYAELYIVVIVICMSSIIIKQFVYDMSTEHNRIYTELIILIGGGVYYLFRSARLGIYSAEVELHDRTSKWSMRKKTLVISIALGIGMALAFGINSAVQYADGVGQSIYYFFMVAFVSLMIYLPFFIIILVVTNEVAKRKSDEVVDKMLDDDESGDDDEKH